MCFSWDSLFSSVQRSAVFICRGWGHQTITKHCFLSTKHTQTITAVTTCNYHNESTEFKTSLRWAQGFEITIITSRSLWRISADQSWHDAILAHYLPFIIHQRQSMWIISQYPISKRIILNDSLESIPKSSVKGLSKNSETESVNKAQLCVRSGLNPSQTPEDLINTH